MRVSSIVLFLLIALTVTSSGCKVGNKREVSATRVASRNIMRRMTRDRSASAVTSPLATRGTEACDCYTCRMKQQANKEYVIDPVYEPVSVAPTQESTAPSMVDSFIVQPQLVTPDSGNTMAVENSWERNLPRATPQQQEIQGQIIADEELTNELPSEPDSQSEIQIKSEVNDQLKIQPDSKSDDQPELQSPRASFQQKDDLQELSPVIRSAPIPAKKVSVALDEAQLTVDESVPELESQKSPESQKSCVIDTSEQIETPEPRRGHSIWFTPIKHQGDEATAPELTPSKSAPHRTEPSSEASAPSIIPIIEHDGQEIKQAKVSDSIVLKARPVDRHLIYNSRPVHAPVREARLIENSRYPLTHQQPIPDQRYIHPLPPEEQRWMSPAPVPVTSGPQFDSQNAQPLPKQHQTDSSQFRLKANAVQASDQTSGPQPVTSPMARVIRPNSPMLKLKAVQAGAEPQTLPSIVRIQRQPQDRIIIGSLQPPQQSARDASTTPRHSSLNRLHTMPWQPMQTSGNGVQQVQQSIRQLMIQPQQEANSSTDDIRR